jgi:hypothetical protein
MENLRQAIRNLEAQAEKYERHLGAERFPSPGEDFFDVLASEVDGIRAELAIPEPKPVEVAPAKPAEAETEK